MNIERIGAPLHAPVWSFSDAALLGLTGDNRIAKVDAKDHGATTFSAPMPEVGENIEISPVDDTVAFVAEPTRDRVALIRTTDLSAAGTLAAGASPSYLGLDSGLRVLLALSKDGSTVTPVDLHRRTTLAPTSVHAGADAELEGAARGRQVEFHVVGNNGIAHYKGMSSPAEDTGNLSTAVAAIAGDGTKVTRVYIAEKGTNRLLAIDSRPGGDGLTIVGSADLGGQIRAIGTDDTRIYAATDRKVVVLETRSFEGYTDGAIPVVRTFDIASVRPSGVTAPVSGMTVGPHRVYLTLRDEPYLISVAKPRV
ncbi:hypothetical protein [Skermania sp. ID1734]|uniref:hypothetical protein n=1 Tax=Skermania sp. ID1734 TaxID=2597516 RepID=UPI0021047E3F|nr:hypothetical protein [Skermania sp. ID1734]